LYNFFSSKLCLDMHPDQDPHWPKKLDPDPNLNDLWKYRVFLFWFFVLRTSQSS
jgi:hypothetical protein